MNICEACNSLFTVCFRNTTYRNVEFLPSAQEQSQTEKMMYSNLDLGFVKQEPSAILCEDKDCTFHEVEDKAAGCNIQEMAGHDNT